MKVITDFYLNSNIYHWKIDLFWMFENKQRSVENYATAIENSEL